MTTKKYMFEKKVFHSQHLYPHGREIQNKLIFNLGLTDTKLIILNEYLIIVVIDNMGYILIIAQMKAHYFLQK